MLGDLLFRRTLAIGTVNWRAVAVVAALATVPLGLEVSAAAQLGALVVLTAGALAMEARKQQQ
jgi:hypothetical protein